MYFLRTITDKLRQAAATRPSLIVTGARQTGKTTLLKAAFPEASYIIFDNILAMSSAQASPLAFLERFRAPVILDEIQYVPGLFAALNRRSTRTGSNAVAGSSPAVSASNSMKNVSESLAGRIALFHLETLSAAELRTGENRRSHARVDARPRGIPGSFGPSLRSIREAWSEDISGLISSET